MIKSFPKIWALGNRNIADIFDYDVEMTEKIDGSQFCFGKDKEGNFQCRSKGVVIDHEGTSDKLFRPVIDWSMSIQSKIPHDTTYYGETLKSPKHNTLEYERVPTNHFVLFGVSDSDGMEYINQHKHLHVIAKDLGCDVVPLLHEGKATYETVEGLLNQPSYLGGCTAEGVVVKAYEPYMLYGMHTGLKAGKFVTEKFKEQHQKNPEFQSKKGKVDELFSHYKTEARWTKAVQYLRDCGQLERDPKDIGNLLKRVNQDVEEECKDEVASHLYTIHRKAFLSRTTMGLPQWYKEQLAKGEIT